MRLSPAPVRSRPRGARTGTGPRPVMIARSGRWPWRTSRWRPSSVCLSAWRLRKAATSASTACASRARAPSRRTSVSGSENSAGWISLTTLSWIMACHSFGGEVEARTPPRYAASTPHAVTNFRAYLVGGNGLVVARARAEKVAEFIVSATEPSGGSGAFEAPHGSIAAFDAPVVLLQPVVQVGTGPVPHALAQLGADRPGVAVVAIGRDPVRCHPSHRFGRPKERLRCFHVAVFTEQHVDQGPVPVDGAVEIAPAPMHFQVRFIDIPAAAYRAAPAPAQLLGQGRGEFGFPLPDRFIAEHDAAHGEHLGQIAQAQLVAQAPEHHEGDDVGGILGPVQQSVGALVELLAARTAAEPAIALGGALRSLRDGLRAAFYTPHPRPPFCERRALYPTEPASARGQWREP